MVSAIDATKPVDGVRAVKADLRTNLATAKSEIETLQGVTVFDVGANLNLTAAHNGAVIRCTAAALTLTWPNLGNFSCTVIATTGAVIINGTGATNATIPDECAGTLLQATGTQNVFVSAPRVIVSEMFKPFLAVGAVAASGVAPTLPLEAENLALPTTDRITNTVDTAERQRWWGFGWGLGVPSVDIRQEAAQWADRLFDELGTKVLRFNGPDDANQPTFGKGTVDVGIDNGVDTVIATGYWARRRYTEANEPPGGTATYTPTQLAEDIHVLMNLPMLITHACLQNEPDGLPQGLPKNALVEPSTGVPYNMSDKYTEFRTALNARGRTGVHIIGCEWAHFGNPGLGEYDTLNAAGKIPNTLGFGAGHCYHDCPTNNDYDSRWMTKAPPTGSLLTTNGMWSTETGSMGMPHWGARSIAGLNHGTVVEVAHIGVANNSDGGGQTLIHSNGTRHPEHGQARVIFGKQPNGDITIPRGSRFRLVHSSDWPAATAMSTARLTQTNADRMIRNGGTRMPRINSACCKRPDGRWTFVACNATTNPETVNSFIDARYAAATIQITVTIPEMVGLSRTWSAHRAAPVTGTLSSGTVNMNDLGQIRFTLAPGETIGMISS